MTKTTKTVATNRILFDVDVSEDELMKHYPEAFDTLFIDRTMSKGGERHNIFWATSSYESLGAGYGYNDQILPENITGKNRRIIMPRARKDLKTQRERIKKKGEVFTPAWICNAQNNLVTNAWFDRENVFNVENDDKTWTVVTDKIVFPKDKSWQEFVTDTILEMACGEAPYLASRYDTVSGKYIPIKERIGMLDRKMRVVEENTETEEDWILWATKAVQSIYGFEWQGDSLMIARENILVTFIEYYYDRLGVEPDIEKINEIAEVASWNLWQMDGLKCVIPNSCKDVIERDLFGNETRHQCPGCRKDKTREHTGIYCQIILDWDSKEPFEFVDVLKKE